MATMSKTIREKITQAFYGAGYAMQSWAGDRSYFKHATMTGGNATAYHFRNFLLDLVELAEVREGKAIRKPNRKIYAVSLAQMQAAMRTSVMHHESIVTGGSSIKVRTLENSIVEKFKAFEQYLDFYLGEYYDEEFSCNMREVLVRVKTEYSDQVSLSFRHKLSDVSLRESVDSLRVRATQAVFG